MEALLPILRMSGLGGTTSRLKLNSIAVSLEDLTWEELDLNGDGFMIHPENFQVIYNFNQNMNKEMLLNITYGRPTLYSESDPEAANI